MWKCGIIFLSVCTCQIMYYALLLSLCLSLKLFSSTFYKTINVTPTFLDTCHFRPAAPGLVECKTKKFPWKYNFTRIYYKTIQNGNNILLFKFYVDINVSNRRESNELNFNWIIKMLTQFHAIANMKHEWKKKLGG